MSDNKRCALLNEAFLYVDDAFLDLVEREKKIRKRKKPVGAFWATVAACICFLFTLPVVAMTYNWFGLRDLLMPREIMEPVPVTLAEYQEKPEIQALREWQDFLTEYDPDKAIRSEAEKGNLPAVVREDWRLYGVYSLEMGEKLDEIADKYDLKLHTEINSVSPEILEAEIMGKLLDGVNVEVEKGSVYEDGSFWFQGNIELMGYGRAILQFGYASKGVFDQDFPVPGEMVDYRQWQYVTSDQNPVLLISESSENLILADFDKYLITVKIWDESGKSMTETALKNLVDKINFSVLKNMYLPEQEEADFPEYDLVTLSGYQSSPEAKALAEWKAFLAGYDIEAVIGTGNSVFIAEGREDWSLYAVYNYEMGEKLDEIADKYHLKLYSEINFINPEEMEYRVGGNVMKDCTKYWGFIYGDGTFYFNGDAELAGCGTTGFQFGRAVKGTFGDVILNIGQVEEYEQWQYHSAYGEPVLLALGPCEALIFADFEECFVSVNVMSGSEAGMTKEDLQELADRIDFMVLKDVKIPEMRGDSEVPKE